MTSRHPASLPPFKTKKAVKEALALGSRWAMERFDADESFPGTVVRASSTSRWIAWDGSDADRPMWLALTESAGWKFDDHGFTETSTGTRLRFLAAAPAVVDTARLERMALPRNRREDECTLCGDHVAARAGHVREGRERVMRSPSHWTMRTVWEVLHAYGACDPVTASAAA